MLIRKMSHKVEATDNCQKKIITLYIIYLRLWSVLEGWAKIRGAPWFLGSLRTFCGASEIRTGLAIAGIIPQWHKWATLAGIWWFNWRICMTWTWWAQNSRWWLCFSCWTRRDWCCTTAASWNYKMAQQIWITLWGGQQNQPWVLGTLIYEGVKLERGESLV